MSLSCAFIAEALNIHRRGLAAASAASHRCSQEHGHSDLSLDRISSKASAEKLKQGVLALPDALQSISRAMAFLQILVLEATAHQDPQEPQQVCAFCRLEMILLIPLPMLVLYWYQLLRQADRVAI